MSDFLTIYHQDYVVHPFKKIQNYKPTPEKTNCIEDSFKHYLTTEQICVAEESIEYVEDYLENTFKKENPGLYKRYYPTGINIPRVQQLLADQKRTTYHKSYCIMKHNKHCNKGDSISLPADTKLPETTYLSSYREPTTLNKNAFKRLPKIIAAPTLSTNSKVNKDLGIKMEMSEYEDVIGRLGETIVVDDLYCMRQNKRK